MPLRELASGGTAPTVDIVAVHGLNPRNKKLQDHAWDTWRKPAGLKGRLWLRDYLPNDVPDARIFLYEYDSAVLGSNKESFVDAGSTLLEWLRIARHQEPKRPLLFICHSLGGLLVKQALVNAHANVFYSDVGHSVFSLVFFGSPHEGGNASLVRLGSTAAGIARNLGFGANDSVVMALQSGSVFADCLREAFRHQLEKYRIVSFWEGRGNIVSKQSATFGLPGIKENIVRLEADHRSMCKFDLLCPEDKDNYSLVIGNLLTHVASARAHRIDVDVYESPQTHLDRDTLDAYYQVARVSVPLPAVPGGEVDGEVSWVTATAYYRSWIADPTPNVPAPLRVLWCQTGSDTDSAGRFASYFLLKDMSALIVDCRRVPSPPSTSSSSTMLIGDSRISSKHAMSGRVHGIIWGLLVQSFAAASAISMESFGRHILTFLPPKDRRSGEELANLAVLLSNSLATWAVEIIIILDHLESLDKHELVQLDRAIAQLLQHSKRVRFMLLSKVIKPGPLLDNALLVDQDTAYRECSNTFYSETMTQRRDHIATACIGTNHWVWSNPCYRAWATDSSVHALWIAGKPGSGKSVLARTIEDELTGKGGFRSVIVATWFYSIRDNMTNHSAMLSGLLYQMLQKERHVFQLISKRYCEKREHEGEIYWSFSELQDMLAQVVRDQSLDTPIFLVLDGIDESSQKGVDGECSRAKLLQFFLDTLRSTPAGRVKMIILSRLEDDIRSTLRKTPTIVVHHENSKDIEKVVDLGIQSIRDELNLLEDATSDSDDASTTTTAQGRRSVLFEQAERARGELIQYIRRYLVDHADGIILWVSSVISHLHMQLGSAFCTLTQLATEIKNLSTELSEVYVAIVRNMVEAPGHTSTLVLAQRALLWVRSNHTLGKFYAQDLLEVLAMDQDQAGGRWVTVTGWASFHKQLTRLCGPFLEIVSKENGWDCGPYDPIQLFHQTVKAFLDDPHASAPLHLSIEESASRFESDCIRYLQKTFIETQVQPHPLLAGAAATLDEMIHRIITYLEDRPLLSFILSFHPKMSSSIPACYKEIFKTLIMLPASAGGLGVGSLRKLFYEACKNGRTNAICSLFAISSQWLHLWEWYLIEPEIIEGTLLAAKEVSAEMCLSLHQYISCREILCGAKTNLEWNLRATLDSDLKTQLLLRQIGGNLTRRAQASPDIVRAIDEVLSFWMQLAGSPELQTPEAFRGAGEPHFSECPDIAWRMGIIRATVLNSKSGSNMAQHNPRRSRDSKFQLSGGLRIAAQDINAANWRGPICDSPLRKALSRIEEAPSVAGPASLSAFVWQEKLRTVVGRGSGALKEFWNKHEYFFTELPPILPSILPPDRETVIGESGLADGYWPGSSCDRWTEDLQRPAAFLVCEDDDQPDMN